MNAISTVEDEVRELVRRRGLDPVADPAAVRRLVDAVITDYNERGLSGTLPQLADARQAAQQVFDAVAGFGPLQKYLDDLAVEEIWINDRPGRGRPGRRTRERPTRARSRRWDGHFEGDGVGYLSVAGTRASTC